MDVAAVRIAIVVLGVLCALCVGAIMFLEASGKPTPPVLGHAVIAGTAAIIAVMPGPGRPSS